MKNKTLINQFSKIIILLGLASLSFTSTAKAGGLECPHMVTAFIDLAAARYQLNVLAYRNGNGQVAEAVRDLADAKSDVYQGLVYRSCNTSGLSGPVTYQFQQNATLARCPHKEKARQLIANARYELSVAIHKYNGLRAEGLQDARELAAEIEQMLVSYSCE